MATRPHFNIASLRAFDASYETTREDRAFQSRGDFLRAFPRNRLEGLDVNDYVIGRRQPTFCDYVEAKTRSWAAIQGATSFKFGIYYGRTKSDPRRRYRFASKFGDTKASAFKAVKEALLQLVSSGAQKNLNFAAIDANPLSQLFKAKILSLYYPERFLNVCSAEHLEMLGVELGFSDDLLTSEYQHLLAQSKQMHAVTRSWGNPKFMEFLYTTYVRAQQKPARNVQAIKTKRHRRVNFEDIQNQRTAIGKAAEQYALAWEKERLRGAGLKQLIRRIEDRRDRPSYGYDFLSYTTMKDPRYIEVKSVRRLPSNEGYRFFLSENEHLTSKSTQHLHAYFFYLVFFDGNGKPVDLHPMPAKEMHQFGEMVPASYIVRFDMRPPR